MYNHKGAMNQVQRNVMNNKQFRPRSSDVQQKERVNDQQLCDTYIRSLCLRNAVPNVSIAQFTAD
jgi:hypothetical protein